MSRTKRLFLTRFLVFLVTVSMYAGAFWWLRTLSLEAYQIEADLVSEEDSQNSARTLERFVRETSAEREAIDNYFLTEEGVVGLLSEVESLGMRAGVVVDFKNLMQQPQSEDASKESTPLTEPFNIELSATGERENLLTFVEVLSYLPYKSIIERISIEPNLDTLQDETAGAYIMVARLNLLKLKE